MNHYDAWMIVFVDVLSVVKYLIPPFLWMLVGSKIFDDGFEGDGFIIFIFAIGLTYWSYQ